jgi:hypothetical protein
MQMCRTRSQTGGILWQLQQDDVVFIETKNILPRGEGGCFYGNEKNVRIFGVALINGTFAGSL